MKFSTRQDADLPAESLFAAISDFAMMERMLLRRGVSVRRDVSGQPPHLGSSWALGFDWRGKARQVSLELTEIMPPERIGFAGKSDMFEIALSLSVVALTKSKSRLICEIDVAPKGMKARLLLQTARLSKTQLDRRFAQRIGDFVDRLSVGQLS
ncbi:SRPBCC family protein [Paracoccus ravus]|uniref:SRPBCC family protein n=1 Tax=Paracoccus ravus TaxID=2447760 RepID=UPI00106EEDFF|nr:SRPBCC family protein [Paracoccus ravus]